MEYCSSLCAPEAIGVHSGSSIAGSVHAGSSAFPTVMITLTQPLPDPASQRTAPSPVVMHQPLWRVLLVCVPLLISPTQLAVAQEIDTTSILQVVTAQSQLDSLRLLISRLETELETLKLSFAEGADIQRLLVTIGEEELDDIPEDQRSKRKRVDALLKAISDRPGVLRFNGGATTVLHWNPGSNPGLTTATGSFDIFAHTSLGEHTLVFFDIEAIGGNGPDARIANSSVLNADAGSTQDTDGVDRLTVLEAWTELTLFDEVLTATLGKIDITNYFDNNAVANDETSQFLAGAFVNNLSLPAFANSPGIRVRTSILDKFFVQAAIARIENSGDALLSRLMKAVSVGMKIFPETDTEGNVRVYGYVLPAPGHDGGFGISYDQSFLQSVTVFGRYGSNRSGAASLWGIRDSWSAGMRFATLIDDRRFVAAAAYGENRAVRFPGSRERIAEIYARIQLNRWAYLSPHLQWILPHGAGTDHVLLSIRTQFNF